MANTTQLNSNISAPKEPEELGTSYEVLSKKENFAGIMGFEQKKVTGGKNVKKKHNIVWH